MVRDYACYFSTRGASLPSGRLFVYLGAGIIGATACSARGALQLATQAVRAQGGWPRRGVSLLHGQAIQALQGAAPSSYG